MLIWLTGKRMDRNGEVLVQYTEENKLENLNIAMGGGRATWVRQI